MCCIPSIAPLQVACSYAHLRLPTLYCSCLLLNQVIQGPSGFSVAGLSRAQAGGNLPLYSDVDSSSSEALKPISPAPGKGNSGVSLLEISSSRSRQQTV